MVTVRVAELPAHTVAEFTLTVGNGLTVNSALVEAASPVAFEAMA